ncbi:MAG: EF-hand domain-containing protein [Phycisphaerales bacterium]
MAALACAACAGRALAQPTIEAEPNNSKNQANQRPTFTDGVIITGTTTGATTSPTGTSSIDYYRVVAPGRPGAEYYRFRLLLNSTTPGHVATLRGRQQQGGAIFFGSDVAVQTSAVLSGTTRFNQYYAFAPAFPDLYYAVTGTAQTTGTYTVSIESALVTPIDLGVFRANTPMRITTVGQGHSTDTEIMVFQGFGNDDDGPDTQQSTYTFTPISGTFVIAISDFNLCADDGSISPNEGFRDGNVLDFPGPVACSSTASNVNVSFSITDGTRTLSVPAVKQGPFDVVLARFSVSDFVCAPDFNGDGLLEPGDLDEFITAFFSEIESERARADFNEDGLVEPGDLDEFLTAYFEGCGG